MSNNSYVLSCCSTADVTEEYLVSRDINWVCFHYMLGEEHLKDDLFKSMAPEDFYQAMVDGAETKTSQVNVEEYVDYFSAFLKEGRDIIHITLSSGISGTLNSATIAAEELREQFPDRKIFVVDSLSASAGYGVMMDKLADLRDAGYSVEELNAWILEHRLNQNTWFFSTDLTFFVKGGRISKASGWFGTALNICPLLNVNNEGKLIPRTKCRGKKLVKKTMIDTMKELCSDGTDYADTVFLTHSACEDDANDVAELIRETFPNVKKINISYIGPTIGAHTGPGTVALGFWGKEKTE